MVGPQYDLLQNPLGAVRLTFEAAAAAAMASDPESRRFDPAAFDRRDWGAVELFRAFLFDQGGISQVPILNRENLRWIRPNSLVRFRGMVQDMFGSELYIGLFKDGSTWRTNKFVDVPLHPMPHSSQTRLSERRLLYCVPVPGQNQWTLESTCSQIPGGSPSSDTSPHGEKRRRDNDDDAMMDINVSDIDPSGSSSSSKKQREDEPSCQMKSSAQESNDDGQFKMHTVDCFDMSPLSCLVKIYDTPDNELKLNDIIEFIGVYTFDPELAVHKEDPDDLSFEFIDDVTAHLPPSKVPRLHCLLHRKLTSQDFLSALHVPEHMSPEVVRGVRASLLKHLTAALGNDGLAAHCVLLHLLSKVRARVDLLAVGKLSLNLAGFTRESASIFGNQMTELFKNLLPISQEIPLSVEYLNTASFQPRKDNQAGRMVPGVLQFAQGAHLMIDETYMNPGTLNSTGVENARLLKHLMEWQMVEYDFQYYKLEMPSDVQLLVLSEGKSNILPADLVLPFRPSAISPVVNATPEDLQAWRWYLATLKSLPHSIEPPMQKTLEDELVSARKEDESLRGEDLSRLLTMGQLMSASFGETRLSLEHWQMVMELERLRKERLGCK